MKTAPFAVFALLSQIIVSTDNVEVLQKLLFYGLTVLLGLTTMIGFYLLMIFIFTKRSPRWFLRGVIGGAATSDVDAAAKVEDLFRSIVVVRGGTPMPPRDLIPLRMPATPGSA